MKRILYFLLGLAGWIALLCSVAASQVANGAQIKEGFLRYAQTGHLNVSPSRYGDYAAAISAYLNGSADAIRVPVPGETRTEADAFSPKENLHMQDVRRIVTGLKLARWIGGAGVILAIAGIYCFRRNERPAVLKALVRGFAASALAVLLLALALAVWGAVNFQGLFWTFHRVVFTNDLWLLNPQTDLLVALMPLPFFSWYAGEIVKSLLPIGGVMLLTIIAFFRTKERT